MFFFFLLVCRAGIASSARIEVRDSPPSSSRFFGNPVLAAVLRSGLRQALDDRSQGQNKDFGAAHGFLISKVVDGKVTETEMISNLNQRDVDEVFGA